MAQDPAKTPAPFLAACLQFEVRTSDVGHNLAQAEALIAKAGEQGASLVVLPELWTTSFVAEPDKALTEVAMQAEERVRQLSTQLDMIVVGGGLQEEGGAFFNTCSVFEAGQTLGTYRKIHLFSPNAEDRLVSPGTAPLIVETRLGRLGVVVCYDLRFPELVRYYFHQGVGLLAVPAQWPEARSEHWRTLLVARAIENQMFVLGCNRTGSEASLKTGESLIFPGDSRIVDPMGAVLSHGDGGDGVVVAEIEPRKIRMMRKILPIRRDLQPEVYARIWADAWPRG